MFAKRLLSDAPRVLVATGLALTLVLVALLADGAGAASTQKTCPDPHGSGRQARFVRVTGVGCASARALIRKVVVKAPKGCLERIDAERTRLKSSCRVSGYRCTARGISDNRVIDATCRRGAKRFRFQY